MVDALSGFFTIFKEHGPWAFVAILGVVIWRMAIYIQAIHAKHQDTVRKLLLDHNQQQREETKQLVGAMTSTEKALESINQTLNALAARRGSDA